MKKTIECLRFFGASCTRSFHQIHIHGSSIKRVTTSHVSIICVRLFKKLALPFKRRRIGGVRIGSDDLVPIMGLLHENHE
jgi:hypothetical protein